MRNFRMSKREEESLILKYSQAFRKEVIRYIRENIDVGGSFLKKEMALGIHKHFDVDIRRVRWWRSSSILFNNGFRKEGNTWTRVW